MRLHKLSSLQQPIADSGPAQKPAFSSTSGVRNRVLTPLSQRSPPPIWSRHEPLLLGRDEALIRAQWSNLFIMRWYGPSTKSLIELAFGDMRAIANQFGSVAVLSILELGTRPPDEEARRVVVECEQRLGSRLKAIAYLPHSQGFLTSVILSLLVGLKQVRPRRIHAEKVFTTPTNASAWLEPHILEPASIEELAEIIAQVRRYSLG